LATRETEGDSKRYSAKKGGARSGKSKRSSPNWSARPKGSQERVFTKTNNRSRKAGDGKAGSTRYPAGQDCTNVKRGTTQSLRWAPRMFKTSVDSENTLITTAEKQRQTNSTETFSRTQKCNALTTGSVNPKWILGLCGRGMNGEGRIREVRNRNHITVLLVLGQKLLQGRCGGIEHIGLHPLRYRRNQLDGGRGAKSNPNQWTRPYGESR